MACTFNIDFTGSAQEFIEKIKAGITGHGIFGGDASQGAIDVSVMGLSVKGTYIISGNTATIEVTDKPFLISCSAIQKYFENYLQQQP